MPTHLPILPVFAENDYDREQLCKNLRQHFEGLLHILPVNIATRELLDETPRAVVVNLVSAQAAGVYFPRSRPLLARRMVSGNNLERLIELPAGERVLVVGKPEAVAREMCEDLQRLGIQHLELIPYWPDGEPEIDDADTVVYAGFRSYCPEGKARYINIGYRAIAPSTLAEIVGVYSLPADCINVSHLEHIQLIVAGLYRTQRMLGLTETLKSNFEQVSKLSVNALINLNHDDRIVMFNPAAERLLGIGAQKVLGMPYSSLQMIDPVYRIIHKKQEIRDELIYIRKQPVLATLDITSIECRKHLFLSLTPVESLQGAAEKARASLHRRGFTAKNTFENIIGDSPALRSVLAEAKIYAQTDATVLLFGESGSGKELFAQAMHNASRRADGPFVGVNFAAISENLIESELFGYEEGAFTGASKGGKQGLFRLAHNGTIFLDEIGDISPAMQSRLLRVLEEREIMPVGSTRVIPVDVRIVCATNKDLRRMMEQGAFREDLYYRFKVFTLEIPPLHERREDIPALLEAFCGRDCLRLFSGGLADRLLHYNWPGNVRELKTVAQYCSMLGDTVPDTPEGRRALEGMIEKFLGHHHGYDAPLTEEELDILRCIRELCERNRSAGRYALVKHPLLQQHGFTESRMKSQMKRLESMGYLIHGKTRQGASLTSKAVRALGREAHEAEEKI